MRRTRAAVTVEAPVLREEVVDAFPAGNPDIPGSPSLLAPSQFSLSQECSNGLGSRSEGVRRLGHCEFIAQHCES